MKRIIKYITISVLIFTYGCSDYLDVIPDKTQEIELLFERKETTYRALAACYHFIPQYDNVYASYAMASDEITTNVAKATPGVNMMRGLQNASSPLLGFWDDNYFAGGNQKSLFKGIRYCNIFIENVESVKDMTAQEKKEWKAEAIFLKAYYHFLLMSQYGPIPIVDENLPIDASVEDVRVKRKSVDEVVEYIVNTIDLALTGLPEKITNLNELGRVDQVAATAIKSRVLLYAASPLFNGNALLYDRFVDNDGKKLFNTTLDKEKWKAAAEAAKTAIELALKNGAAIYEYKGVIPSYDTVSIKYDEVKALYNYRYMMVDRWNSELLWGNSNPVLRDNDWPSLQAAALIPNPNTDQATEAAWGWAAPTLDIVEAYYTENGLPIDEDKTFSYESRYNLGLVAAHDSLHLTIRSIVPNLHMKREPRFYASIAFDRNIYRTWGAKWSLQMMSGEKHGRKGNTNDYSYTGYLLKKVCHPSSEGTSYDKLVAYPWPLIRLGELYLNYAEAMNEYYGPSQEVYDALNKLRRRAKIRDVEDVWSDATYAKTVDKHKDQKGLREIIKQERRIELAFEGGRNFDVRRWMEGDKYFKGEVKGWSVEEKERSKYYTLRNIGQRTFIVPRDYLHPIKFNETVLNSNLVQNPGW